MKRLKNKKDLIKPIFKKQSIILVFFDIFVSLFVYLLIVYLYLFNFGNKIVYQDLIIHGFLYCAFIIIFRIEFNTYKLIWRYAEISSFLKLIESDTLSCLVFIATERLIKKLYIPLTITDSISLFLVNLILSIVARVIYHYVFLASKNNTKIGIFFNRFLSLLISKEDLEYDDNIYERIVTKNKINKSIKRPQLTLMYITNDINTALIAEKYGVNRIWVDLEQKGKRERQGGLDTVMSNHSIEDVKQIAPKLSKSQMLVRINPWDNESKEEIDKVISAGAELIMLPMWKTVNEVKEFINAVNRRAKTILLLETKEAEECLDDVLKLDGIDEIHIGLNDLHLSYGLTFMFELLSNGTVERICKKIKKKNIPYGFGGIARIGEGALPAENIVLEHYRLGSTRAILSRAFCNTSKVTNYKEIENIFKENMKKLREFENYAANVSDLNYLQNKRIVKNKVSGIVRILNEMDKEK